MLPNIHTERKTPIPAKITVAGENACQINIRVQISDRRMSYQANSSDCLGESKKDIDGGIEPLCPSFIAAPGSVQPLDLLL